MLASRSSPRVAEGRQVGGRADPGAPGGDGEQRPGWVAGAGSGRYSAAGHSSAATAEVESVRCEPFVSADGVPGEGGHSDGLVVVSARAKAAGAAGVGWKESTDPDKETKPDYNIRAGPAPPPSARRPRRAAVVRRPPTGQRTRLHSRTATSTAQQHSSTADELLRRQRVPPFDLHWRTFPQVRYCRGCSARPAGGTGSCHTESHRPFDLRESGLHIGSNPRQDRLWAW